MTTKRAGFDRLFASGPETKRRRAEYAKSEPRPLDCIKYFDAKLWKELEDVLAATRPDAAFASYLSSRRSVPVPFPVPVPASTWNALARKLDFSAVAKRRTRRGDVRQFVHHAMVGGAPIEAVAVWWRAYPGPPGWVPVDYLASYCEINRVDVDSMFKYYFYGPDSGEGTRILCEIGSRRSVPSSRVSLVRRSVRRRN